MAREMYESPSSQAEDRGPETREEQFFRILSRLRGEFGLSSDQAAWVALSFVDAVAASGDRIRSVRTLQSYEPLEMVGEDGRPVRPKR